MKQIVLPLMKPTFNSYFRWTEQKMPLSQGKVEQE